MNKTTLILCILVASSFVLKAQVSKQGFDNSNKDTWDYTSNIPFYSKNNGTDIWGKLSKANGRIARAFSGTSYIAGRDLDNAYSEVVTGEASPEHILMFNAVNLNGLPAEISFRVHYVGLDSGDYIRYEVAYNDDTEWNAYDYKEDIFKTNQNGRYNSQGWKEIKHNIPSGHEHARMRLIVYQNGNAYLGFDDFQIETATLSSKYDAIEGFSFGPNPTEGQVTFRANTVLDNVTVYNILGKELFRKKGHSTSMEIDLSTYPSGIYIAKITSGTISQSLKIIKK
ncbi:T9SS type A sorting domain-containing protein [Snuella sedimenti]|uniref:T9SS type A sorting domain-containing protein n=1 Tax=Snuella sedimenti TaxID=2798802 RepID=A0A8J7LN80_9FLAO|nr:T9SS type A sorting domain-containing protein [Snuella sedimenti]MBJ6368469.1 T9SS type A sorting domain-containing protein [Snuella sedimenti]